MLLVACSPTLDWRQARPEGAALVVLLPCKPERRSREVVLGDAPAKLEVLACSADGTTWGLSTAELGDAGRVAAALAALRAARVANLEGRETEARAARIDGMSAEPPPLRLRVEGRRPDGETVTEHSLLFARGTQVFHAVALGGRPSAEALETFFGSIVPAR